MFKKNTDLNWEKFYPLGEEKEINAKTMLLHEGKVARYIYFIKKGCLRMWINKDGKDVTFQFFFENQPVASVESLIYEKESLFSIESIEPSVVIAINKAKFLQFIEKNESLKHEVYNYLFQRFRNFTKLFLSRIKDTPKERYNELIINCPEIIQRVPQHYIASYLGVTPVSLSRIRSRK